MHPTCVVLITATLDGNQSPSLIGHYLHLHTIGNLFPTVVGGPNSVMIRRWPSANGLWVIIVKTDTLQMVSKVSKNLLENDLRTFHIFHITSPVIVKNMGWNFDFDFEILWNCNCNNNNKLLFVFYYFIVESYRNMVVILDKLEEYEPTGYGSPI